LDNVVTFTPRVPRFSQQDLVELHRWAQAAAKARWFIQCDPDGGLVSATEEDNEFVVVSSRSPSAEGAYIVMPTGKGWSLLNAEWDVVGDYQGLGEALGAVCKA
jgi:hypothetical protein